jgi:hypothetical protein
LGIPKSPVRTGRRILDLRGGKKKGRHIAGREIGEEV